MKLKYYNQYNFYDMTSEDGFTIIPNFPTLQQKGKYACGPACIQMVLNYFGDYSLSEEEIASEVKTKDFTGTKLKNMVKFFAKRDYIVKSPLDFKRDKSGKVFANFSDFKAFLLDNLKKGYPIILENVDYGGHYKVLIGYDEEKKNEEQDMLIFADPDDRTDNVCDGYFYDAADRFFSMWFDNHCLEKRHRIQPFLVIEQNKKE